MYLLDPSTSCIASTHDAMTLCRCMLETSRSKSFACSVFGMSGMSDEDWPQKNKMLGKILKGGKGQRGCRPCKAEGRDGVLVVWQRTVAITAARLCSRFKSNGPAVPANLCRLFQLLLPVRHAATRRQRGAAPCASSPHPAQTHHPSLLPFVPPDLCAAPSLLPFAWRQQQGLTAAERRCCCVGTLVRSPRLAATETNLPRPRGRLSPAPASVLLLV